MKRWHVLAALAAFVGVMFARRRKPHPKLMPVQTRPPRRLGKRALCLVLGHGVPVRTPIGATVCQDCGGWVEPEHVSPDRKVINLRDGRSRA